MEEKNHKPKILVFVANFYPSKSSGGAIRSIVNLVEYMSNDIRFNIICRDRDYNSYKPFKNIIHNKWLKLEKYNVFYTSPHFSMRKIIKYSKDFDYYYLNSFFDFHFSIKIVLMRFLHLIPQKPVIIAPRGELMSGALSLKSSKKLLYILISKIFSLYRNFIWHGSTELESESIKKIFGESIITRTALDIPDLKLSVNKTVTTKTKKKNFIRILFISVINKKKNLKYALDVLNNVKGDFVFDIYGPVKDKDYFEMCLKLIGKNMSGKVFYKGEIEHPLVADVYPNYNLFFFPTLGENFGHVVAESLYAGCPVLTSQNLPWVNLQNFKAGWNIPLQDFHQYIKLIENLISLDSDEYFDKTLGCRAYIEDRIDLKKIKNEYCLLFNNF